MIEDPGGVEPLGARIKSPLPNRLRLERSGSIGDGDTAASRPGFAIVMVMLVSLVLPHGNDPRSSGYRPGALPLSYGRVDWCFVADSNRRSPACRAGAIAAKLTKRLVLWRSRTRTWECRCVGPMPWPLSEASNVLVHPGGLEPPRREGGRF